MTMNIGGILPHTKIWGGVRRFVSIGSALTALGHEYTLFTPDGIAPDWLDYTGKMAKWSDLDKIQLDACICGDAGSIKGGLLDKANAKLKIVYKVASYTTSVIGDYSGLESKNYLWIGNSSGWSPEANDSNTISGGIDIGLFKHATKKPNKKFKVLFYALPNRPWKDTESIIAAITKLPRKDYEFHSFSQERHDLGTLWNKYADRKSTRCPIKQHVGLTQTELAKLYRESDVLINTELEGAGTANIVLEAMASGTPVITTKHGSQDFAFNSRTALVIGDKQPDQIAGYIKLLKKDSAYRAILANNAHLEALKFDWSYIAQKLVNYVKSHLPNVSSNNILENIEIKALKEVLSHHIHSTDRVLDLGCGYGQFSEIVPFRTNYEGIDRLHIINQARKLYKDIAFVGCDPMNVIYENSTCDVVICSDLITRRTKDIQPVLYEALRLSRRFIIVKVNEVESENKNLGTDKYPEYVYNRKELMDYMARLGKVIDIKRIPGRNYSHTIFVVEKQAVTKI